MSYQDEQLLPLSGLQHFAFCRRQWALIHVEQQWAESYHTADGRLFHDRAHDGLRESRGDRIITRSMRLHSYELGLSGECDVLEFHRGTVGIPMPDREGLWQPFPAEYKRGEPGSHTPADALQLCAQAMCLEEMLCVDIPAGALFYGQTRRRTPVEFTPELRAQVVSYAREMHQLYARGQTPKVKPKKGCSACSLRELCLPKLVPKRSALAYIRSHTEEGS